MSNPVFEIKNLTKTFKQGSETLDVLQGVNLALKAGEIVAMVGASGSGAHGRWPRKYGRPN